MEKNLIVTGSSGLVGSEIVELLSKENLVTDPETQPKPLKTPSSLV